MTIMFYFKENNVSRNSNVMAPYEQLIIAEIIAERANANNEELVWSVSDLSETTSDVKAKASQSIFKQSSKSYVLLP